jgi:hypothetical protein
VDLFCDGTGIDPKLPLTRLVAWAVVLAGAHPTQPHTPLAWGGVPGQTRQLSGLSCLPSSLQLFIVSDMCRFLGPHVPFGVIVSS